MNYKTLKNKREVDGKIDFLDLTFDSQNGYKLQDVFTVTASYVMRWDKISSKYYGTADYGDALYKFNNYDNPFSLGEGDVVDIPTKESLDSMYKKDDSKNAEETVQDVTPVMIKSTDNARTNFLIRKEQRNIPTINDNPTKIEGKNGIFNLVTNN